MFLISRWMAILSSDNSGRVSSKEMRRFKTTAVSQNTFDVYMSVPLKAEGSAGRTFRGRSDIAVVI